MRQKFKLPFLKQHTDFRGADQRYIGLALDVLLAYLDWKPHPYEGHDFGKLSDMKRMSMFEKGYKEGRGRRITIKKIRERKGHTEYEVEGFPDEANFEDFQKRIPKIYNDLLNSRINFKNPQFSIKSSTSR